MGTEEPTPGEITPEQQAATMIAAMDQLAANAGGFGTAVGKVSTAALEAGASGEVADHAAREWATGFVRAAFPQPTTAVSLFGGGK